MYRHTCAIATAIFTCAVGLQGQSPPQLRFATFDGASLHIKGDPSKPVIMQGYTDARQLGDFSWDNLKAKLGTRGGEKTSYLSEALVNQMLQDDEAAGMLLNMHYARKHQYSYVLYSYKNMGGWAIDGACSHQGNATPSHWCKVQAMEDAIERFGRSKLFLWLDSDVIVRQTDTDMWDYLNSAERCQYESEKLASNVAVFSWVNTHWFSCPFTGRQTNSGVVALQRGSGVAGKSDMKAFLEQWWLNREWGQYGGYGKNDQHSFNEALKWFAWKSRVVFSEDNFRDARTNYFTHKCGACDWMPEMSTIVHKAMEENNITSTELMNGLFDANTVADLP